MDIFSQKARPLEGVLYQEVSGETVLLDLRNECYFGLNDVGTRVWQLLVETERPDEVLEIMRSEYEIEESVLKTDIEDLIRQLVEKKLLELIPVQE